MMIVMIVSPCVPCAYLLWLVDDTYTILNVTTINVTTDRVNANFTERELLI